MMACFPLVFFVLGFAAATAIWCDPLIQFADDVLMACFRVLRRFLSVIRSRIWPKVVLLILAIGGTAAAGDCRYVAHPVKAVHVAAVKKVIVAPTHHEVAIIAVEQYPHYDVHLVAADLRAKQRAAEYSIEVSELKEATKQNTEAIRLLGTYLAGKKAGGDEAPTGARPLPLRSAEDPADEDSSLDEKAVAYLRANCAQCHSGDAARGKVTYFTADKKKPVKLTPRLKYLAWSVVDDGTMPPAGEASAADKQMLKSWVESDRAALRELVKASDR
ncbi:MAG: hypothetical protein IT428_26265 [Planctomycetaceae bacterium]|nr:hypothetical protein [Planctomycetaceae bacterium]